MQIHHDDFWLCIMWHVPTEEKQWYWYYTLHEMLDLAWCNLEENIQEPSRWYLTAAQESKFGMYYVWYTIQCRGLKALPTIAWKNEQSHCGPCWEKERGVMQAAVVNGEESRHKATTSAQMMPKNPCTGRWKPTSGEVGRGWKLHEEVRDLEQLWCGPRITVIIR